jgi:hypothetical protein
MEPQNNFEIEEKLQELEKEINRTNPSEVKPESPVTVSTVSDRFLQWFQALPKGGQVAVLIVGVIASLTLVKILVELISLSIGLGFMAVLLYLGYKLFLGSNTSNNNQG